ncbi:MAG TPA: GIY-YIG nuclease family protein [Sphingomonas sp.]|nr:GIY-YIG nuclease family protein [Sphingomonas sp.]HEX4694476.1 GIY-YIG nuclease family protein [Sphingomonas sp.]
MRTRPAFGDATGGCAVWRRDETALALLAAFQKGRVDPSQPPPAIIALADFLSVAAARSGRGLTPWSRSPRAVALKVNALWRGIADEQYRARLGAVAIALLAAGRDAVAREAADAIAGSADAAAARTHGPVPAVSIFTSARTGADARVYAMVLTGSAHALAAIAANDVRVFKVGRSDDVDRRVVELNSGMPRVIGLQWTIFATSPPMPLLDAHDMEQALLDRIEVLGLSAGGEFAKCCPHKFARLLVGFGIHTTIRPAVCAIRASTASVMPGAGLNERSRSARPPSAPVASASVDSLKWPCSGRPMPASASP